MTQELRVMVGIPGSGKSTKVAQDSAMLEEEHRTVAVISRDAVRFSMLKDDEEYFSHEDEVFDEFIRQINECMEVGIDVVFADATHISPASRFKLLSRLLPDPNTKLVFEVMNTSVAECLNRNQKRDGRERVPHTAIRRMAKGFQPPCLSEFPDNYGFKDITINTYVVKGVKNE